MLEENEFLLGVNKYCLNYHSMNNEEKFFSSKEYLLTLNNLFNYNFCLTNKNLFNYNKLLTREKYD